MNKAYRTGRRLGMGGMALLLAAAGWASVASADPADGEAWHITDNTEVWGTATMRDPLEPAEGDAVWFRVGTWPDSQSDPQADTTVVLNYEVNDAAVWTNVSMEYETGFGSGNAAWSNSIAGGVLVEGDVVEYYFSVVFSSDTPSFASLYLGTVDHTNSVKFATEVEAEAAPFGFTVGPYVPVLGNIWHYPTNAEPWETATMRDPLEPLEGREVWLRAGSNPTGLGVADSATGMTLGYRVDDGPWIPLAMAWETNYGVAEENACWTGVIPAGAFVSGDEVEYYFAAAYTNDGATNDATYLGTADGVGDTRFATEAGAQENPFRFEAGDAVWDLGNAWHVPGAFEPWPDATMRNPVYPYQGDAVCFFVGNQAFGGEGAGNMTGGTLYHRAKGSGDTWAEIALEYEDGSEAGNNKFWKGILSNGVYATAGDVEYYFKAEYSSAEAGSPKRDTTFIGAAVGGVRSSTFGTAAEAQSNSFTCPIGGEAGTEPGYVWHAGNVVRLNENTIQLWVKTGYANEGGDWVKNVKLHYNVTNAPREGRHRKAGVVKAVAKDFSTSNDALDFIRAHEEADTSEHGNATWWYLTFQANEFQDQNYYLEYQISATGSSGIPRYADYKTSSATNTFYYTMWGEGANTLTINYSPADYTTSKFFIDEAAGESVDIEVRYSPPTPDVGTVTNVQIYSNVGRRDYWNADIDTNGIPDSILPPSGDLISTNMTNSYYVAIPMGEGPVEYTKMLTVNQCGAYRLTARYQVAGSDEPDKWHYYSETSSGRRDHAVVVSPKKVLQQNIYELNALTVAATAATLDGRSTFASLINPDSSGTFDEFGIEYLNKIQANCLWFQPIHRSTESGINPTNGPGSPYATKDYFSVSKWFGRDGTQAGALAEFQDFVAACDAGKTPGMPASDVGTINIMLDGVMNHTSWDAVLGDWGVDYLTTKYPGITDKNGAALTADTPIGFVRPGWFANYSDYGKPATFYDGPNGGQHDFACGPDRGDFGKWYDTAELFYGRYAALVRHNPDNNSQYLSEEDWFDYSVMTDGQTAELWEYMGAYPEYWIKKTGHSGTNTFGAVNQDGVVMDELGIDGLRCDFAQGLPPQFWEYLINRTRATKWNFMFMAESLDGGNVSYRSNRHFDILNESFVFQMINAGFPGEVYSAFSTRKGMYSGGAVLLNLTSHDEIMPYSDPWQTASRYAMTATMQGLPMIFYGQEQGIVPSSASKAGHSEGDGVQGAPENGFSWFELNMGKWVPHFKNWNKLTVWDSPPSTAWDAANDPQASRRMAQWYGRLGRARLNSPALMGSEDYFLARWEHVASGYQIGNFDNDQIFAVAKSEEYGALKKGKEAILGFVLFVNGGHGLGHAGAEERYSLSGYVADMLGLEDTGFYSIRNLAAADPAAIIGYATGADLLANGIHVTFTSDSGDNNIYDDGAIVQYLKLESSELPVPVFTISGAAAGQVGETLGFDYTVTLSEATTLAATFNGAAFDGFTNAAGRVGFTPAAAGTYTFTLAASNQWAQASTNIAITVYDVEAEITDISSGIDDDGNVKFTVSAKNKLHGTDMDLVATDIWIATNFNAVTRNWDWSNQGTHVGIDAGSILISFPPDAGMGLFSIGRPKTNAAAGP